MRKISLYFQYFLGFLMVVIPALAGAQMAVEEDKARIITAPSGLEVELHEVMTNQIGDDLTYRFRFVAPKLIESGPSEDDRVTDMKFLCEEFALSELSEVDPTPLQVVISIADKAGEFGVYDPDINEFFEFYRVNGASCSWKLY